MPIQAIPVFNPTIQVSIWWQGPLSDNYQKVDRIFLKMQGLDRLTVYPPAKVEMGVVSRCALWRKSATSENDFFKLTIPQLKSMNLTIETAPLDERAPNSPTTPPSPPEKSSFNDDSRRDLSLNLVIGKEYKILITANPGKDWNFSAALT